MAAAEGYLKCNTLPSLVARADNVLPATIITTFFSFETHLNFEPVITATQPTLPKEPLHPLPSHIMSKTVTSFIPVQECPMCLG
jgi:hypothetical protein